MPIGTGKALVASVNQENTTTILCSLDFPAGKVETVQFFLYCSCFWRGVAVYRDFTVPFKIRGPYSFPQISVDPPMTSLL